jgi:hypothetical protein
MLWLPRIRALRRQYGAERPEFTEPGHYLSCSRQYGGLSLGQFHIYAGAQVTGVRTGVSICMGCTLRIMIEHF